jgi:hypothetical protein
MNKNNHQKSHYFRKMNKAYEEKIEASDVDESERSKKRVKFVTNECFVGT